MQAYISQCIGFKHFPQILFTPQITFTDFLTFLDFTRALVFSVFFITFHSLYACAQKRLLSKTNSQASHRAAQKKNLHAYIPVRRTRPYTTRAENQSRDQECIPSSRSRRVRRRSSPVRVTSDQSGCTIVVAHDIDTGKHAQTRRMYRLLYLAFYSYIATVNCRN